MAKCKRECENDSAIPETLRVAHLIEAWDRDLYSNIKKKNLTDPSNFPEPVAEGALERGRVHYARSTFNVELCLSTRSPAPAARAGTRAEFIGVIGRLQNAINIPADTFTNQLEKLIEINESNAQTVGTGSPKLLMPKSSAISRRNAPTP
ncbi:hypothetical protein EVAR_26684_1 [Eumeta japonica]|uniref:Uncharacterized protein n=1 Tax=Eumeta variegata TaxID=151549 RepID=A0A4C1VLX9_EUMVA|nr:hypothetical protein EVAR_26684_1 [Eumeta japonica]